MQDRHHVTKGIIKANSTIILVIIFMVCEMFAKGNADQSTTKKLLQQWGKLVKT